MSVFHTASGSHARSGDLKAELRAKGEGGENRDQGGEKGRRDEVLAVRARRWDLL